jgi:uncharacterized protein YjbI with pentapeptide repeats
MLPNAGAAMADEEHLARLKKDIDAWNAWRLANTEVPPDLTGADLTGAKLVSANLTGAKLVSANLTGADLTGANLTGANLIHANLSRATLFNANLNRANLFNANLIRANLTAANLTAANLTSANLNGAKLADALFRETVFGDSDLTSVTGLETCNHYGPSVIDHRTLQKSRSLPMLFLRGVGLPERLIEYLPTLLNQAIQYYSCFISYSTKDQEFAERIHSDLQNKGVRCWFAPHDMPIGGKILDEIDTSVRLRDKLLLILSENSINSEWVEIEVTTAFEEERKHRKIVLFPIRLDDAVIDAKEPWAGQLRRRNIGDFRKWKDHDAYTRSFDRVLRDLAPKPKRP